MSGSQTPTRLVVRFGEEILEAGFTTVPNLVLRHYASLGITPAEMMFIIHVWEFWWSEREPYPALSTIAERMQMTRRNVRKYVQSLREKNVLIVTERFDDSGQTTSEYDFSPLIAAVLDRSTPLGTNGPTGSEHLDRAPRNVRSYKEDELKQDKENEDSRIRIQIFVEDFAREMKDRAPLSSSVSRAVNLYDRAGRDWETFKDAMYEAREKTRGTANVRNRMSFWFAVLEDLLGLKED